MNREIKFRVYDKDFKKMRYLNTEHDFICFDEEGNGYYHNMQTGLGEWFSDLMQYTGLKDKNGVEIYEGDIVRLVYDNIEHIYQIIFDKEELDFKATNGEENYGGDFQYLGCCEEIEVIGNIYENEVD